MDRSGGAGDRWTDRLRRWVGPFGLVLGAMVLYSAWMTGGSFRFSEIERFPNHHMLARAFAEGRTWIEEQPRVDVLLHEDRRYLYFGPLPAAFRAPGAALGIRIPTGLMVAVLCAALCLVFAGIVRELATADDRARPMRALFIGLFALNGLTLFMAVLPSVHHESILWAALFLLLATLGVLRAWRGQPTVRSAAGVGVAVGCAVASRVSYLVPALVLAGALVAAAWAGRSARQRLHIAAAAVAPLMIAVALLGGYNRVRFGSVADFGLQHLTSRYQSYIQEGHFWRLDHVPYNLWDYLCRTPRVRSEFPYLEATISLQEVSQRTATPQQPYRLIHVNELAVSVFVVVPALVLMFPALRLLGRGTAPEHRRPALLFVAVAATQLALLSLTIASTARYMFDFMPYCVLLAFLGAERLRDRFEFAGRAIALVVAISLVLGLFLPLVAAEKYLPFVGFRSPLLDLIGHSP